MLIDEETAQVRCDQCGKNLGITPEEVAPAEDSPMCGLCTAKNEAYGEGSDSVNRALFLRAVRAHWLEGASRKNLEGWFSDALEALPQVRGVA